MRRRLVLGLAAGVLAAAAIHAGSAALGAGETCDGLPVTIQGATDGADHLVGTEGADVINGLGGPDMIDGNGGDDRICGSGGRDRLHGNAGRDRMFGGSADDLVSGDQDNDEVFGFDGLDTLQGGEGKDLLVGGSGLDWLLGGPGDDELRGGPHDDDLNGGAGSDDCAQGGGSGPVEECERADLKATVTSPASAPDGAVTFTVKVKNRGPDGTTYFLDLDEDNHDTTCNGPQPWEPGHAEPLLADGATRTRHYTVTCTDSHGGQVWVKARAVAEARDPVHSNDADTATTTMTGD
jgi:Ca2+-binding RTX toxin-like protein